MEDFIESSLLMLPWMQCRFGLVLDSGFGMRSWAVVLHPAAGEGKFLEVLGEGGFEKIGEG
jgi:hypothetical protein